MKHKEFVEEYNVNFSKASNSEKMDISPHTNDYPSFEPSEREEIERPSALPQHIPRSMPTSIYTYSPILFSPKSSRPVYKPITNNTTCPTALSYDNTRTPTLVTISGILEGPIYTVIPTYSPSNLTANGFSYYSYVTYNTVVFGMATGIGSFCFCVICAYVYKIYASKKHKLHKIQENSLKREYESLNDIQISDYNSIF